MKLRPRNTAKVPTQPPVVAHKLAPIGSKAKAEEICDNTCATRPVLPQDNAEFLHQIKTYVQSFVEMALSDSHVYTINSIVGGGSLTNDLTIQLENDELNPGAMEYYGTNNLGIKGFHMMPVGGSVQYQDEGTNLGLANTVDTVNFTGPLITASRTGNTVRVDTDILVDAFNIPI